MITQSRLQTLAIAMVLAAFGVLCSRTVLAGAAEPLSPGRYTITIVENDIPSSFPPEVVPILLGVWELEFTGDGTAIASKNGEMAVLARYIANPARLVTHDVGGPLACTEPGTATAVYALAISDREVMAEAIHDRCAGRNLVMTAHPWQQVQ